MKCLYCDSDDHPWFNCRKKPEGWKPPTKLGSVGQSGRPPPKGRSEATVSRSRLDASSEVHEPRAGSNPAAIPLKSTASRKDAKLDDQRGRAAVREGSLATVGFESHPVQPAGIKPRPSILIEGAKFVANVPEGTQLLSFGNRVIAAGPGLAASIVTKDGLVPITMPLDQMKKGGRPRTRTPEEWKTYKADKERERRAEKAQKES